MKNNNGLRAALASFILWILPITALIVTLAGTDHPRVVFPTLFASGAILVGLLASPPLRRTFRRARERLSSDRTIRADIASLGERIGELQERERMLEEMFIEGMAEVTAGMKATADVALYTARWSLGARALYLDRMARPVYFVHSHRPEEPPHLRQEQVDEPRFTMPPVPVDEADFIPMASQWVLNSPSWVSSAESIPAIQDIQVLCACGIRANDPIMQRDLVLIGSTVYNEGTRIIQKAALERKWLGYEFVVDERRTQDRDRPPELSAHIAGVPAGPHAGSTFRPDPEETSPLEGKVLTDYGLLTRMPNPLSINLREPSFVVIVGGCLLAGQVALTEWLSRPASLHQLSVEFEDRACQYVVKVNYTYDKRSQPKVDKDSVAIVAATDLSIRLPS